uniref:NmrA domain-containing protein n=1 Tax=Angiostrongylus cantonensis TaxID=6313 RepID=A0A0K0CTE6_ANGCA
MSAPVVLVTGVSSTVGKAIVRRLAFSGYNIAAADRCSGDVIEVAADNKKVGGKVAGFAVDLADKVHRSELISRVVSEMGKLDSLIVVPPDNDVHGDIIDTEVNQFNKLFRDRLTLPFRLTQAALPSLQHSKYVNGIVEHYPSDIKLFTTF